MVIWFLREWTTSTGFGANVLTDISLTIKKGSKVSFVGISGSGKTTLAKMMVNFYQPNKGTIRLGGTDIQQVDKTLLRQQINYLPPAALCL